MNEEIYSYTVTPATESPDGETAARYVVTKESNGFALWFQDHSGDNLLRFERFSKNEILHAAVISVLKATGWAVTQPK